METRLSPTALTESCLPFTVLCRELCKPAFYFGFTGVLSEDDPVSGVDGTLKSKNYDPQPRNPMPTRFPLLQVQ